MVDQSDKRYGVVLDAGSSGTRVYIYRWLANAVSRLDEASLQTLPELETKDKWTKKVHPGVSTFGATPETVGPDHLKPLLDHALDHIPKAAVPDTPIFLLGTAGMRLLPDRQQKDLLRNICSFIKSSTKFALPDCDVHIQVIPGETEGLYGWVAANYLLGGFNSPEDHEHGKGHHTYGFLDMGGASAQIAFAPNATEAEKHANDLTLLRLRTINGMSEEYRVFVTTWLGFGANEARRRYVQDLEESYAVDGLLEMPDPCLPAGLKLGLDGTIILGSGPVSARYLHGTGKFDECLRRTFPLLEKDVPCPDEPCLVHGVHVPAIDFDVNHFIGISEYWHTTHEIFEMGHKDKAYDFNTYQNRVKEFCEQDWSAIERGIADETWGKKVDAQTALEVCFKASWLINMLHDGIGIPRVGIEDTTGSSSHNGTEELLESGKEKGFLDAFQAVNQIKSTEVSWTMGKMVLYASAEIPPARDGELPVGFGSNVPGIPKDFQYPGGGRLQPDVPDYQFPEHPSNSTSPSPNGGGGGGVQSITDHIHDTLFKSDAPHRLPGFIFFLLILVIAIFYLCGRDRRARIFRSVCGDSAGPRRPLHTPFAFLNKLLNRPRGGGGGVQYDRPHPHHRDDLEDGTSQRLYDPDDFELGSMSSDDDDGGGGGGHHPLGLDRDTAFSKSIPPRPGSAGGLGAGGTSPRSKRALHNIRPEIMDRRGVVVRTESRERLAAANANANATATGKDRTKSRSGSPARLLGV